MRLCSAAEMAAIDRQAIDGLGIPGVVLMENAGRGCSRLFDEHFPAEFPGPVLVVAGKGNNGGDGYVMARILADLGWQVSTVILAEEGDISGDAERMLQILAALEQSVTYVNQPSQLKDLLLFRKPRVVIDAILGTGLKSQVRGLLAEAIRLINGCGARIFSVDIPSGVDGSNGRICGSAVQADLTVTFDHAKIGHGSLPGAACCGRLEVVDIGIPRSARPEFDSDVHLLDAELAGALLPERSVLGHKGKFGHLLVLAGSTGKTGAAALAGNAAVRSGCGLVTVATPAGVHDIIEVKLTEAMSWPLADRDGMLSLMARQQIEQLLYERQALAVGPGLGQSQELAELLRWLVASVAVPLVIDADGLNLLAGQLDVLGKKTQANLVLTPHPGEMARLSGLTVKEIEANRFEVARDFAREHNLVLLLKGARTVIAGPDGRVMFNTSGNDGLASGGSGDVLTGLIGGLLAQGVDPFAAAALGAWLHGRAAELVAARQGTAGMAASDLPEYLPMARQELMKGERPC